MLERAHGGTLLLDEVSDMPLETQGKIVRALQDSTFERLGGSARVKVDVRVLSTTNRDLQSEIAAGRFREDLYYRLAVVPLKVPALRERREDVPPLAQHFIARSAENAGMQPRELSADTLAALQAYDWPGNVRQLRNLMDWLLIMAPGGADDPIRADMLPPEIGANAPALLNIDPTADIMGLPLREARDLFETQYLQAQLLRFGGNISRTAQFVGMERSALHRKLKQLGVNSDEKVGGYGARLAGNGGCDGRVAGTGIFAGSCGTAAHPLGRVHRPDVGPGAGQRAGEPGDPAEGAGQRFPALRPGEPEAVSRCWPCPSQAIRRFPTLARDLDIRTDLPRYRVWRHGELVEEPTDIDHVWRDDLVSFAIGCSFSFEEALIEDGIEVRHIACGRNVPMYRTIDPVRAGRRVPRAAGGVDAAAEAGGRDPRGADHLAVSLGARRAGASRHAGADRHQGHRASRTMATRCRSGRTNCRCSGPAA